MRREPGAGGHRAHSSRAQRAVAVAALGCALLLPGCATGRSVQRSVGGWFDRTGGRLAAQGEPIESYAAVDRVKVHREPDSGSPVKGVLNRHERIRRYQSQAGFAYVAAAGDLWGWVAERQLVARIPKAPAPERVEPAQSEAAPEEAPPGPEGPLPTDTAPAPDEPGDEEPAPDAESPQPERSVFDPY